MTRKEAGTFMWEKNDETPSLMWAAHKKIRELHDELLSKIYDDHEQEVFELKEEIERLREYD